MADWTQHAACDGLPTRVFFPAERESPAPALKVCAGCPVRAECLAAHLDEQYGVWGGTTVRQRRAMRTGRNVVSLEAGDPMHPALSGISHTGAAGR